LTVRYTIEAHRDLLDAINHVAPEILGQATRLVDRLLSVLEQLERGDFEGAETRLTTGEAIRSWAAPPYRIYYEREPDGILVIRIYHQARRPITK